ncbi:HEPN domain-containing protein [Colwellia sp. 4_MG-2023]|uniref:HEPN domain-containing protein n=1 Tax=unclassified Colwellia TaxID=196834 RepID=UPI0026E34079|nr:MULTISPECIES: HEPN domain-containing protein [unclassified Colwellia]MDO6507790.1 HEPN domain-containing protein [Colwellia sp. 5_MG-2023]MDO6556507.1 HEPN domain-containing protein [Colwellia sp. 4_MG-2023]
MEEFKVEQLIVLKKDGGFCNNTKSFNKLLQSNSDIVITKDLLKYKKELEVSYALICDDVEGKEQRFFQVSLVMSSGEDSLDLFVELQREIRSLISKAGGAPETLIDDVSTYYANKAYPFIHRIENLLRKLITNFMIRKIGSSYVQEASPSEFKVAIDNSKRKSNGYMNAMYQVDFKHLSDFLFKPYTRKKDSDLHQMIRKATAIEDLNLDVLNEFVPRSNWQRYFYSEVDCEDTFLAKRWKELYELRCMIAHNAIVNKATFTRIVELIEEVEKILQTAVDRLDKVDVPEDEQDIVAENVVSNINDTFAGFIFEWNLLEQFLADLYNFLGNFDRFKKVANASSRIPGRKLPPTHLLRYLPKFKLMPNALFEDIHEIRIFRNRLVHGIESYSSTELLGMKEKLDSASINTRSILEKLVNQKCTVYFEESDGDYSIKRVESILYGKVEELSIKNQMFQSIDDIVKLVSDSFFISNENIELIKL